MCCIQFKYFFQYILGGHGKGYIKDINVTCSSNYIVFLQNIFYNKPLFEVFFPINYFTIVLIMLMVTIIIKIITWLKSGNKFF